MMNDSPGLLLYYVGCRFHKTFFDSSASLPTVASSLPIFIRNGPNYPSLGKAAIYVSCISNTLTCYTGFLFHNLSKFKLPFISVWILFCIIVDDSIFSLNFLIFHRRLYEHTIFWYVNLGIKRRFYSFFHLKAFHSLQ